MPRVSSEEFEDQPARRTIIQCANCETLTLAKAKADMGKAVKAAGGKPDAFKFVCRVVSDTSRTRIGNVAAELGINYVTIWSSVEFEENLRLRAEYLLHRFVKAAALIERACWREHRRGDKPLVLHADNGSAQKAQKAHTLKRVSAADTPAVRQRQSIG